MNYKNVFGDLEYELGKFFVPHKTGCTGQYTILKHEPWYVTGVYIIIDGELFEPCPLFNSWIQAVKFLKDNIHNLI